VSDRRVVLGKRLDGSFGLDVSLPGYDALTADRSDATKFSFSSDWTDIVKYSAFGKVTVPAAAPAATPYEGAHTVVPIPDRGYIPHFEARGWDGGGRVYDDFFVSGDGYGVRVECFPGAMSFNRFASFTWYAIYLVYRYPTDLQ